MAAPPADAAAAQALHICFCNSQLAHETIAVALQGGGNANVSVCPLARVQTNRENFVAQNGNGFVISTNFASPEVVNSFQATDFAFLSTRNHSSSTTFNYDAAQPEALMTAIFDGTADPNLAMRTLAIRQSNAGGNPESARMGQLIASISNLIRGGVIQVQSTKIPGNLTMIWAMATSMVARMGAPVATANVSAGDTSGISADAARASSCRILGPSHT